MNLAFKFPIMFWNCACLISDAGGNEEDDNGTEDTVGGEYSWTSSEMAEGFVDFTDSESDEDDNDDGEDDEEYATSTGDTTAKSKKKVRATNYGRIL